MNDMICMFLKLFYYEEQEATFTANFVNPSIRSCVRSNSWLAENLLVFFFQRLNTKLEFEKVHLTLGWLEEGRLGKHARSA